MAAVQEQLDELRGEMEIEYSKLREAKLRGEVTGSIYLPENQTPRLPELREKMKAAGIPVERDGPAQKDTSAEKE